MQKIKVGMINIDLHAQYYAALLGGFDPLNLRDDPVGRGQAAHFYHYLQYNDPTQITAPTVDGFELVKFWDPVDKAQAENMVRIFNRENGVACDTLEEVSEGVDLLFISDCNEDGSDHLAWATPGLEKGVPTFVDKPFAYEYADAKEIVRIAEAHSTPVMSLSILGQTPHVGRFRARLPEVGGPEFGTVKGGGPTMAGHIHAISMALAIFGSGVASVECMGQTELGHVHLDYGGKADRPSSGVVINCASGATYHCSMYASAYGPLGAVHSPAVGDFEFPEGAARILELVKEMVTTARSPVAVVDMLEGIAVATAARLAQKERRRVLLDEVM